MYFFPVKMFMCPNSCGRFYKRKDSVVRHLKYECGVEPKFKCIYCFKQFTQKVNLNYHIFSIHKLLI